MRKHPGPRPTSRSRARAFRLTLDYFTLLRAPAPQAVRSPLLTLDLYLCGYTRANRASQRVLTVPRLRSDYPELHRETGPCAAVLARS